MARYCTVSYLEMEAAHCWLELGKPEKAVTALEKGLNSWNPSARRDLGLCLARLATAHASVGQSREAVDVVQHSLAIMAETQSHRTARQVNQVIRYLGSSNARDQARKVHHALQKTLR